MVCMSPPSIWLTSAVRPSENNEFALQIHDLLSLEIGRMSRIGYTIGLRSRSSAWFLKFRVALGSSRTPFVLLRLFKMDSEYFAAITDLAGVPAVG